MKNRFPLQAFLIFPLLCTALGAYSQTISCVYPDYAKSSWKTMLHKQLANFDRESEQRVGVLIDDVIDGGLIAVQRDAAGVDLDRPLRLPGGEMTLLELAVAACQPEISKYLVASGATADGVGTSAPLVTAAGKGDGDLVEYLLQHGARVDKVDISGTTAAEASIRQRHLSALRATLRHGASLNRVFPNGASLLDIVGADSSEESVAIRQEIAARGIVSGISTKQ